MMQLSAITWKSCADENITSCIYRVGATWTFFGQHVCPQAAAVPSDQGLALLDATFEEDAKKTFSPRGSRGSREPELCGFPARLSG